MKTPDLKFCGNYVLYVTDNARRVDSLSCPDMGPDFHHVGYKPKLVEIGKSLADSMPGYAIKVRYATPTGSDRFMKNNNGGSSPSETPDFQMALVETSLVDERNKPLAKPYAAPYPQVQDAHDLVLEANFKKAGLRFEKLA
jgi:hypothetical protein